MPLFLLLVLILFLPSSEYIKAVSDCMPDYMLIRCKIVSGSMKFKFYHKIAVIHEMFLVLSTCCEGQIKNVRGPDPVCIPTIKDLGPSRPPYFRHIFAWLLPTTSR